MMRPIDPRQLDPVKSNTRQECDADSLRLGPLDERFRNVVNEDEPSTFMDVVRILGYRFKPLSC